MNFTDRDFSASAAAQTVEERIRLLKETCYVLDQFIRREEPANSTILKSLGLVKTLNASLRHAIKQFEALSGCGGQIGANKPAGQEFMDKKLAEKSDELAGEVQRHAEAMFFQSLRNITFPDNKACTHYLAYEGVDDLTSQEDPDASRIAKLEKARATFLQATRDMPAAAAMRLT